MKKTRREPGRSLQFHQVPEQDEVKFAQREGGNVQPLEVKKRQREPCGQILRRQRELR